MFRKQKPYTEEWQLYEKGKEYHYSIGLYDKVNTNERFYRGDQWDGIQAGGLPTPVFNIFRRIIDFFTSSVLAGAVKLRFSSEMPTASGSGKAETDTTEKLNRIADFRWDKQKMDALLANALRDAAITGDAVCYTYWDPSVRTGQAFTGDFVSVLVDNTNVFFGNPNSKNVEKQPYILISMRETVEDLRAQAKLNGASEEEIRKILPDDDTAHESGDLAKKELENTRCIALIKLWKGEDGRVRFRKSTKNAVIKEETDLGLSRYPLAVMNWTPVKNSWHGQGVATGLIENQIFINKGFAMVMKHMTDTAFSKVIYDKTLIPEWTNEVGEAVGVKGGDVRGAAVALGAGNMQSGFLDVINLTMMHTKELMGATDAALGEVDPDNTSAILALQESSNVPLENIRQNLYACIEDLALNWAEMMFEYYPEGRFLPYDDNGESKSGKMPDYELFKNSVIRARVDVGAGTKYSQIVAVNTLDKLLSGGFIGIEDYLERLPDGIISDKRELIEKAVLRQRAAEQTETEAIDGQ